MGQNGLGQVSVHALMNRARARLRLGMGYGARAMLGVGLWG